MPPRLTAPARALLRGQRHVVATWQGRGVGLTPRTMRRAVRSGAWSPISGRTFLALDAAPDQAQRRVAGALQLGPCAQLAGLAALAEQGWSGDPGDAVDVIVPRGVKASGRKLPLWLRVHERDGRADAPGVVPLVAPAPSVVDAVGWARTDREAMFIVVSALQQRTTVPAALLRVVAVRPQARRAGLIREVAQEFTGGSSSMGELDLVRGCRRRGLPEPQRQRRRRDADGGARYVDAEFRAADGVPVLVEVDGAGHHTAQGRLRDVRRQRSILVPDGARFLSVTPWELRYEPDSFYEDLKRALRISDLDL